MTRHTVDGVWERVAVIGRMALPSSLPPSPDLHEPDVLRARTILQNGYLAARDVADLEQPDLHQVHYHQERVLSDLVPLLDAISTSVSDAATLSWCYATTTSFVNLYARLTQREKSAKHRFDLMHGCRTSH